MDLLLLALLGGLLALDGTSVGQFMVSRPLVAGVFTGWIVGDPALGLLVGGVLELFFLPAFPVGGASFPEEGPSTVVAVATASLAPEAGALAVGALLAFLWARLGAGSIRLLRRVNGRLVPDPSRGVVTARSLVGLHVLGIGLDFLRGLLLTGTGVFLGAWLVGMLAESWPLTRPMTVGVLALGASIPLGGLIRGLGGWRRRGLILAAGLLLFLLGSLAL